MKSYNKSITPAICVLLLFGSVRAGDGPIAVDVPVRTTPVDFDAEICRFSAFIASPATTIRKIPGA